jgi:hypothetical protein
MIVFSFTYDVVTPESAEDGDTLAIIRRHPGTAILPVAREVGPHGSLQFGYRTVHRLIVAGLVRAEIRNGRYRLFAREET